MQKNYKEFVINNNEILEVKTASNETMFSQIVLSCAKKKELEKKQEEEQANRLAKRVEQEKLDLKFRTYYSREHLVLTCNYILTLIDLGLSDLEVENIVSCVDSLANMQVETILANNKSLKDYFIKLWGEY